MEFVRGTAWYGTVAPSTLTKYGNKKLRLIRRVLPHVAYLTYFSFTFFYNKLAHEHHQILLVDTGRSSSW